MRQLMRLLKIGVPWNVAINSSVTRRFAMIVAAGEIEGGTFDWGNMRWEER